MEPGEQGLACIGHWMSLYGAGHVAEIGARVGAKIQTLEIYRGRGRYGPL